MMSSFESHEAPTHVMSPPPKEMMESDPRHRGIPPHESESSMRWPAMLASLMTAFVLFGCSSSAGPDLSAQLRSVHTAMQSSGLVHVGTLSTGYLETSQSVTIPLRTTSDCMTIVALGDQGVRDLSLTVFDPQDSQLAANDTHGPEASLRFCPNQTGTHSVRVLMAKGAGGYAVSAWSGAPFVDSPVDTVRAPSSRLPVGTCDEPLPFVEGQSVIGNTTNGSQNHDGRCVGGTGKEVVYRMELAARYRVTITVEAEFDSVLYVRREDCDDTDTEVACNDDAPGMGRRGSRIDEVFEPGTYYIFVDSYVESEQGEYRITTQLRPAPNSQLACGNNSPLLPPGASQNLIRATLKDTDLAVACSCRGRDPGPTSSHRLDVTSTSRVRVDMTARGFRPVLFAKTGCGPDDVELVCSTASIVSMRTTIAKTFEPGQYTVFAASVGDSARGDYELAVQVYDPSTTSATTAPGDTCGDAISLTNDRGSIEGDTFSARSDITLPCVGPNAGPDQVYRFDLLRR
ncbi:MAG: hypothetical protein FWD57_10095, partial [Polyangiaceae bacterium]|nr:hypothetical protein [Polyangiaceae bacterium]